MPNRPSAGARLRSASPRRAAPEASGRFEWCLCAADFDHPDWGIKRLLASHEGWREALAKLRGCEGRTWGQLRAEPASDPVMHWYERPDTLSAFNRKAIKRIATAFAHRAGDEMFAMHITGKRLLWGFKDGPTFHILWWEQDHTVYYVGKKHT